MFGTPTTTPSESTAPYYPGLKVEAGMPFAHESVAGLTIARRMVNPAPQSSFDSAAGPGSKDNLTIDWVEGGLWLLALPGQSWENPYHWLSAMVRRGGPVGRREAKIVISKGWRRLSSVCV